jgi:ATP-dependent Clp protease protease subunit
MYNQRNFEKYVISNKISSATFSNYRENINKTTSFLTPYIVEERNQNVAVMDVFSRLMMNRIIFLGDPIDEYTANIINAQLLYLNFEHEPEDGDYDINFYVNSPGGSVYDGYSILDMMDYVDCDVSTVCVGLAASMAAVILSHGEKGKRKSLRRSRIMIHQPLGGAVGQATEIEIANKEIQLVKTELSEILCENTGNNIKKIKKDMDRDKWMTSKEALDYGIIDEIVKRQK